jgi:hypothetical protein
MSPVTEIRLSIAPNHGHVLTLFGIAAVSLPSAV